MLNLNKSMNDTNSMRLFIAIPLPTEIKNLILSSIEPFKRDWPFQKWVHPDDLHLTLKFLGNVAPSSYSNLESKLNQIAARSMPFGLTIKGNGTFGSPSNPSVLWAGISGNLQVLQQLQADVEQQAAELGYPTEARAYSPHITLARRFQGNSKDALLLKSPPLIYTDNTSSSEWVVDRLTLYRTHMGRSPMYEAIGQFVFYAGG